MNQKLQKEKFIQLLVIAAKEYNKLISKEIILSSDQFINEKTYKLRFYKTNFLHLTGIKTTLSAKDFFNKCFNQTILINDINDIATAEQKYTIKDKLTALHDIYKCFQVELFVQEDFERTVFRAP